MLLGFPKGVAESWHLPDGSVQGVADLQVACGVEVYQALFAYTHNGKSIFFYIKEKS